jgi:hypothetical protein
MVREALQDRRWVRCVIGRLSVLEITDYMHLWAVIEGTQLSQEPDKTVWEMDSRQVLHLQISLHHDAQRIG